MTRGFRAVLQISWHQHERLNGDYRQHQLSEEEECKEHERVHKQGRPTPAMHHVLRVVREGGAC